MSTAPSTTRSFARVEPPQGLPRMLTAPAATSLGEHHARFGPLWSAGSILGADLVHEVTAAGLRGRGGAGFPTGTKLAAVVSSAQGRRPRTPIVVANGTEGEPASAKDAVLLWYAPHLVLDGMVAAASAVGADEAVLCIDRTSTSLIKGVQQALAERARANIDHVVVSVVGTPARYVAGEETALVQWLNGGEAKPMFVPPRPFESGVDTRPTLVDNVETLAGIGLIARFGADWWRTVGTDDDPGAMLVTLGGAFAKTGVREVAFGTRLGDVMDRVGLQPASGVLLGGYFGTWHSVETAASLRLTRQDLQAVGAGLGCGAVFALPARSCPLAETARVARWLAGESAGQCGPCAFGLPSIARGLEAMVHGDHDGRAETAVRRWLTMVNGRGACKLPDGVVRFVGSALDVFADHLADHRRAPCRLDGEPALPVPHHPLGWR